MRTVSRRTFKNGLRACYRSMQEWQGNEAADEWAIAAAAATIALRNTHPGFETSYALSRESDDLPGGPYRDKLFGVGRKKTHRIVFRVTPAAIELVAVRHLAQDDLTPLDL